MAGTSSCDLKAGLRRSEETMKKRAFDDCFHGRVCAGAHGTEPDGGSRAKPIPEGIGKPDDPDPVKVSVRYPRARGRGISHLAFGA
jgi:hypothetical protein